MLHYNAVLLVFGRIGHSGIIMERKVNNLFVSSIAPIFSFPLLYEKQTTQNPLLKTAFPQPLLLKGYGASTSSCATYICQFIDRL